MGLDLLYVPWLIVDFEVVPSREPDFRTHFSAASSSFVPVPGLEMSAGYYHVVQIVGQPQETPEE